LFDWSCCRCAAIGVSLDVDVEVVERDIVMVNIFMDEDVFAVVDVATIIGDAKNVQSFLDRAAVMVPRVDVFSP
jgi:hypothetical protein